MGFVECKICASKPGSPILCESCLSNRATIAQLNEKIKEMESSPSLVLVNIIRLIDSVRSPVERLSIARAVAAYFNI